MRWAVVAALGIVWLVGCPLIGEAEHPLPTLHVLNWKNYFPFDPEIPEEEGIYARSKVLQEFAERHGCRVVVDEVVNESELRDRLLAMQGYYDVVVYSACDVPYLHQAGLLRPIPRNHLSHYETLDPEFKKINTQFKGVYFVPYLSGTVGIIYRKDLVKNPSPSWDMYFDPPEKFQGRIGALDSAYSMFLSAFQYLGFGALRADPELLQEAAELLQKQQEQGMWRCISSDHVYLEELLATGELVMAVGYSGAAARMQRKLGRDRIGYVLPHEGAEIWGDGFVVPHGARHSQLAYAFIDYMTGPEVQSQAARQLLYVPANREAQKTMAAEKKMFGNDPFLHIPPALRSKLSRADITSSLMERRWRDIVAQQKRAEEQGGR